MEHKEIKGQVITNQLKEALIYAENPLIFELPNELVFLVNLTNQWKIYFYGSFTQHGSKAGILFITPQGNCIPKSYMLSFSCTNNIAEYEALIIGLRITVQWQIQEIKVYGDSQLVINQVNDNYQNKDNKLTPCKNMIESQGPFH